MKQTDRDRILRWFNDGLAAVDPTKVTKDALSRVDFGGGRVIVLSIGKASVAMASAAREVLGDRIIAGLVVAKQGQLDGEVDGFIAIEAGHPIPDERSMLAGATALDLVRDLRENDTVVALISGGGSALLESPIDDISLMDMQVTTELLMYAGAGIYELNTVRKALSAIKGGGLRRAMGDARCISLLFSDVIGNDPTVIASGPTVPEPTNRLKAWQLIEDFGIHQQVPNSVGHALMGDSPPHEHIDTSKDIRKIIADNSLFVDAIVESLQRDDLRVQRAWDNWRDDAQDLAHRIVHDCFTASDDVDVLIGGGEATSIVRGEGRGGRNSETALVAALTLGTDCQWIIASLASDGDDGNSRAAGAIVESSIITDRDAANAALESSSSASYLQSKNALVHTGQTGTNVNDMYIALRKSAISGDN